MEGPWRLLPAAALLLVLVSGASAQLNQGKWKTRGYKNQNEASDAAKKLKSLSDSDKKSLWADWKAEFKKSYSSSEDATRYANFLANLNDMVSYNQGSGLKSFRGLSSVSDQTWSDIQNKRLMKGLDPTKIRKPTRRLLASSSSAGSRKLQQTVVPNEWDWRTQGKVPAVRDQGACGSCWAFAAVGALEIKGQIDGLGVLDTSEQQLTSCVKGTTNGVRYYSAGCNGGYSDEAIDYVSRLFVTTESAVPYTSGNSGATGTCTITTSSTPPAGSLKVSPTPGYSTVSAVGVQSTPEAIMEALYRYGPVITYFNVKNSFYSYSTGIYQASSCTTETINHAMIIVGFNKTAGVGSSDSYWIIRNSWGTWGDEGYIKVQMTNDNVGACAMYSGLMLPLTTTNAGAPAPPGPPPSPAPPPASPPPPSPSPPPPRPPTPSPPPPKAGPAPKPPKPVPSPSPPRPLKSPPPVRAPKPPPSPPRPCRPQGGSDDNGSGGDNGLGAPRCRSPPSPPRSRPPPRSPPPPRPSPPNPPPPSPIFYSPPNFLSPDLYSPPPPSLAGSRPPPRRPPPSRRPPPPRRN